MEDKITKNEPAHLDICKRLYALYAAKNHDYDDAFHQTFVKFGRVALAIRLQDKCSRLTALTCKDKQFVKDESVIDTLMDIANYAIMGIMELEQDEGRKAGEENERLKPISEFGETPIYGGGECVLYI